MINRRICIAFLIIILASLPGLLHAQQLTKIMGTVIDAETNKPIPFVNVYCKGSDVETVTDFDGRFSLEIKSGCDSLTAQYIGYYTKAKAVIKNKFQYIDFELQPKTLELKEAVIVAGENPAEVILKKIIKNKDRNNREAQDYFEYSAYTKMQVDANNFGSKLKNIGVLKPFRFVFENVDTSTVNGKAFLPIFLTETSSDIYFRKSPKTYREIINASKVSGMENASVSQVVGDSYQKTNVYDNYISIVEKNFVSPLASFGLAYYRYYLIDSGFVGNRWCYHIMFKPRRIMEPAFSGNMWVNDSTWGICKIDLRLAEDANINLINDLVVNQEFTLFEGKCWMPVRDNLIADINIFDNMKKTMGMYIHKSSYYKNYKLEKTQPESFYNNPLNILVRDSALKMSNAWWAATRPDSLTVQEKRIYHMTDTIQTIRAFKIWKKLFLTIGMDHYQVGWFEIGPILSLVSWNKNEGTRFRFGGRTSNDFSKNVMISGYGAYGTKDMKWKYSGSIWYLWDKTPFRGVGAGYRYDVEQLGRSDNSFNEYDLVGSVARRKPQDKLSMAEDYRIFSDIDWFTGFSTAFYLIHHTSYPIGNSVFQLRENGIAEQKDFIRTSEIMINTHFGFREKFMEGAFKRISLGTKFPKLDLIYVHGFKGILNSEYNYDKVTLSINQWFNTGPLGWSEYYIEGGKIWGTVPFPLLKIHEGNETYVWDFFSFNSMNYYEFMSDQYVVGLFTQHFDGLLFNRIPLLRKLHWREYAYGRYGIGSMNRSNREMNVLPEYTHFLDKPFYEVGAGIENIFKVLRVVGVWRLSHLDHPGIKRFNVLVTMSFNF